MKRIIFVFVTGFVLASVCFAQARTGEVNRGIFYQEGVASWYGGEFNGRATASGEIFNDAQLTAAHPILPFGTLLRVTNQNNNKTVTVRVNDRGPFVAGRILDVSRAAAEMLDMIKTGTTLVIVESLHEVTLSVKPAAPIQTAPPQPTLYSELPTQSGQTVQVQPASVDPFSSSKSSMVETNTVKFQPSIPEYITGKNYRVQVGAYRQSDHAVETFEKLKKVGLNPSYERFGDYYRVVIPGLKQDELRAVSERLYLAGFREVLLREE